MKAIWKGAAIAERTDTVIVEGIHYFPADSLKLDSITLGNHRSDSAWKGQANYSSLMVHGNLNENPLWYYPEPLEAAANIKGRMALWKGVVVSSN